MVLSIHDPDEPYATDTPQRPFLLVQQELIHDRSVSPLARFTRILLDSYREPNSDQVTPSLEILEQDLQVSRHTVLHLLGELEQHGLMTRKRGRHRNTYTLHVSPPVAREIPPRYRVQKLHSETDTVQPVHPDDLTVREMHSVSLTVQDVHPVASGSDGIVMPVSLEVTGPQPVTSVPEGPEVPPVPGPGTPVLVDPEVTPVPTPAGRGLEGGVGGTAPPKPRRPKATAQTPIAQPLAVPKALQDFHAALLSMPGYSPTPGFFKRILKDYDPAWLHAEAEGMADWMRRVGIQKKRVCSTMFMLGWLRRDLERQHAESKQITSDRPLRAVPKPSQNGRSSGVRQISRQNFSTAQMVIEDRASGMDVPDSELPDFVIAEIAALTERGWQAGDPYDS